MASRYDIKLCKIPKVYCGNGDWKTAKPSNNYTRYYKNGTRYECMKSGFGAGMISEKRKDLPKNSLQNIPYVGPVYESNFKRKKITSLNKLYDRVEDMKEDKIRKLLEDVFTKSNDAIDFRAMNSTIMHLYNEGYHNMPECEELDND